MTKQEAENNIESMCLKAMQMGKCEEVSGLLKGMVYAYQTMGVFTGKDVAKIVRDMEPPRFDTRDELFDEFAATIHMIYENRPKVSLSADEIEERNKKCEQIIKELLEKESQFKPPNKAAIVSIRETAGDASMIPGRTEDNAYFEGVHDALAWVLGECNVVLTDSKLFFTYDSEEVAQNEKRIHGS